MLSIFDTLRDITVISVTVRLILAVICGGVIGIERAYKRRTAGFRTHILICLGAAMTTLTSQYLYLVMHYYTDMARLGAQVVAGIGFIGAGTIIVTRRQRVKGLTTAAGLWTAAIIGLALGGGFYEGGLLATILILIAELLFSKLEHRILDHLPEISLYLEYTDRCCLDDILKLYREQKLNILNMQITRPADNTERHACVIFTLRLPRHCNVNDLLELITSIPGISSVEEL